MSKYNPFNILNNKSKAKEPINVIGSLVKKHRIFLFMKGSPDAPQCGFSANTCAVLKSLGAEFHSFDVLSDNSIREGVKKFSNWPTLPQLYVDGVFIGGNDIVMELHENGELEDIIQNHKS